eukprot:ctg_4554.g740
MMEVLLAAQRKLAEQERYTESMHGSYAPPTSALSDVHMGGGSASPSESEPGPRVPPASALCNFDMQYLTPPLPYEELRMLTTAQERRGAPFQSIGDVALVADADGADDHRVRQHRLRGVWRHSSGVQPGSRRHGRHERVAAHAPQRCVAGHGGGGGLEGGGSTDGPGARLRQRTSRSLVLRWVRPDQGRSW